jgi:hypothetical protein
MTRLPLLLVASLLAAALLAGCGAGASPAATVSGHDIKRDDFNRDLRALRDNKQLSAAAAQQGGSLSDSTGTVTATLAAAWLGQLVQTQVVHDDFTARHLQLTAADRQAAQQSVASSFGSEAIFGAFPKWFQDEYLQSAAEIQALYHAVEGTPTTSAEAQAAQQKFLAYLTSLLHKANVTVDQRYGSVRFSAQQGFAIVPPTPPNPREKPATTTTAPNPLAGATPSG